jgi:hypothetical protein
LAYYVGNEDGEPYVRMAGIDRDRLD